MKKRNDLLQWLINSPRKQSAVLGLLSPMTAVQLARCVQLGRDACSLILRQLANRHLAVCLNPASRSSRVYALSELGKWCHCRIRQLKGEQAIQLPSVENLDWELYGWLCYRHRSAVLKTLTEPMRPALLRRRAKDRDPHLRMSSNNAREVLKCMLQRNVVRQIEPEEAGGYKLYGLTEQSRQFQAMLAKAEGPA